MRLVGRPLRFIELLVEVVHFVIDIRLVQLQKFEAIRQSCGNLEQIVGFRLHRVAAFIQLPEDRASIKELKPYLDAQNLK